MNRDELLRPPYACGMVACSRVAAMPLHWEGPADAGCSDTDCERAELGSSRPDGTGFGLAGATFLIQGLE